MLDTNVGHRRLENHPESISGSLLASEAAARDFLMERVWPDGKPVCPRCNHHKIYDLSAGRMRCADCKYTFQPFTGRWLNNGALSPTEWLNLVRLFISEHSVNAMAGQIGVTYNTVYKALNALRFSILAHAMDASQLLSSETGLNAYFKGKRLTGGPKQLHLDTIPVFGIIHRGPIAFIDLVPGLRAESVLHFHMNFHLPLVRSGNLVYSGRYKDYDSLLFCGNDTLPYGVIRKPVNPPEIDAENSEFWQFAKNRLKRFRGVSCQRFPLYLKELEFRFNHRDRAMFDVLAGYLCDLVPDVRT